MRSVIAYNVARLALLLAVMGVLYLLGARGFLLVGGAVAISGLISFVVLSGQRDALSAAIDERLRRVRRRVAEAGAREDLEADLAAQAGQEPADRAGQEPADQAGQSPAEGTGR